MSIGGCSINGTWKTVKTDPADMLEQAPFKMVTFNQADGSYSSTMERGGQVTTNTGSYTWDGLKLTITPAGGTERVYSGRLNLLPQQLILHHEREGEKSTAWLEPVTEGGD